MKPQYYLFSSNEGISNVVMSLSDCMAVIESESEELQGEDDVPEYTIQASYITEEEYKKLHEAEF